MDDKSYGVIHCAECGEPLAYFLGDSDFYADELELLCDECIKDLKE